MSEIGDNTAGEDNHPGMLEDLGGYGFKRYGGVVAEEFHPKLQGKKGAQVYKEIGANDPLIGGAFRGMRLLIRQAPWNAKAADAKKAFDAGYGDEKSIEYEAMRWKDRLEESMYDMEVSWRDSVDDMMSAFQYGYALLWIKWKLRRGDNPSRRLCSQYDDGLWGWRAFELRKQETIERWIYDESDETLIGVEQMPPPSYKLAFLPMDRLIHLRFDRSGGNPEGFAGFRLSYRPYYFGNLKEEIEGTGIERDLSGYPVMQVPTRMLHPKAKAEEKAQLAYAKNLVRKVKRDELEGAVVPSEQNEQGQPTGWKFGLISSGGSRAININESIVRNRVDKLIPLMWEFALLGALESGSRALSSDKTTMVATALGAMMDTMVETLNMSAVARWCRINSVPRWLWPEITHGDVEKENVHEWVQSVVAAANGGLILGTDKDEQQVRERLGLEQRDPDDVILAPTGDDLGGGLDDFAMPSALATPTPTEVQQAVEPQPEPEPELLPDDSTMMTVEEAERWLSVPRASIMRAIRNGKLPGGKVGNTYRIPRKALEDHFGMPSRRDPPPVPSM